jgi:hypothetical protein
MVIYKPAVSTADKKTAKPSKVVPIETIKRNDAGQTNQPVKTQPVKDSTGKRTTSKEIKPVKGTTSKGINR